MTYAANLLTPAQIDTLSAGAEMDRLVAERVIDGGQGAQIEPYSTDIRAAWMLVQTMSNVTIWKIKGRWMVSVSDRDDPPWQERFVSSEADTAPLAICRPVLKAKMK
jgi:hypothetical protein